MIIAVTLLSLLLWPLMVAIQIPLWLLGFPVCYALAKREDWLTHERLDTREIILRWRPRWAWLWDNRSDGVTGPPWWHERNTDWPLWKRAFVWSAWRNPVNSFRHVTILHPMIRPAELRYRGNSQDPARNGLIDRLRIEWAFTWQGIYAGFVVRWQINATHHFSLRIGWKLLPRDRFGIGLDDHRWPRCPFAVQFHPWRKSV